LALCNLGHFMESLPTLLSTKELKALLAEFPPSVEIRLSEASCTVRAPTAAPGVLVKVLSAIKAPRRALWAVRVMPGLVTSIEA